MGLLLKEVDLLHLAFRVTGQTSIGGCWIPDIRQIVFVPVLLQASDLFQNQKFRCGEISPYFDFSFFPNLLVL